MKFFYQKFHFIIFHFRLFFLFCRLLFFYSFIICFRIFWGWNLYASFYYILSNVNLGSQYKDIAFNCAIIANDFGTFLNGIFDYFINNNIFNDESLFENYIKNDTLRVGNNCCNNNTNCPYVNRTF